MAHKNLYGDTIWLIFPLDTATMVMKWNEYNEIEEQIFSSPIHFSIFVQSAETRWNLENARNQGVFKRNRSWTWSLKLHVLVFTWPKNLIPELGRPFLDMFQDIPVYI